VSERVKRATSLNLGFFGAAGATKTQARREKVELTRRLFYAFCEKHWLPRPTHEGRFHQTRDWRWDWAWYPQKLAIEVQGGVWSRGRHGRGSGIVKDMEKYSEGAALGWRVLLVTPEQLMTEETLDLTRRALACHNPVISA
jgi:hypothetical protein